MTGKRFSFSFSDGASSSTSGKSFWASRRNNVRRTSVRRGSNEPEEDSTVQTDQNSQRQRPPEWGTEDAGGMSSNRFSNCIIDDDESATLNTMRRRWSLLSNEEHETNTGFNKKRGLCVLVLILVLVGVGMLVWVLVMPKSGSGARGKIENELNEMGQSTLAEKLANKCSANSVSTSSGKLSCIDECRVATCCKGNDEECSADFRKLCEVFDPCRSVWNITSTFIVPSSPSDIEVLCASEAVETEGGFAQCELACLEATCCWSQSVSVNCFVEQNIACESYNSCHVVNGGLFPGQVLSLNETDQQHRPSQETDVLEENDIYDIFADDDLTGQATIPTIEEGNQSPHKVPQTKVPSMEEVPTTTTSTVPTQQEDELTSAANTTKTNVTEQTGSTAHVTTNETAPVVSPTSGIEDSTALLDESEEEVSEIDSDIQTWIDEDEHENATVTAGESISNQSALLNEANVDYISDIPEDFEFMQENSTWPGNVPVIVNVNTSHTTAAAIEGPEFGENLAGLNDKPEVQPEKPRTREPHGISHTTPVEEQGESRKYSFTDKGNVTYGELRNVSLQMRLEEICSEENRRSGLDGWRNCVRACEAKLCCGSGTCDDALHTCADYDICKRTFDIIHINLDFGAGNSTSGSNVDSEDGI